MSNVPPPRSNTASRWLCWCWTPYASAAAVGSLRIARTVSPAIAPASLVAWRWTSSKYAGTVTTASVTGLAEVVLGDALHLREHVRRDLLRRARRARDVDPRIAVLAPRRSCTAAGVASVLDLAVAGLAPDQPLGAEHRALRVGDHLPLARGADDDVAVRVPRHHRRRRAPALLVVDHGRPRHPRGRPRTSSWCRDRSR